MKVKIDGLDIYYEQEGEGDDILLLHGWGQNKEMMLPLGRKLKARITALDLPGFGESSEPKKAFTIKDYASLINKFIIKLKLKNIIIIGHSFGGKIGIYYASHYPLSKFVALASPCFKGDTNSFKTKIIKKIGNIKGFNKFKSWAKDHFGSTDYKNASPIMKQVLVNSISEDFSIYLKDIKVPTILIWGDKDEAVSIEDGLKMEKMLKDGALIKIPNGTHYAYLEYLDYVSNILNAFIEKKEKNK